MAQTPEPFRDSQLRLQLSSLNSVPAQLLLPPPTTTTTTPPRAQPDLDALDHKHPHGQSQQQQQQRQLQDDHRRHQHHQSHIQTEQHKQQLGEHNRGPWPLATRQASIDTRTIDSSGSELRTRDLPVDPKLGIDGVIVTTVSTSPSYRVPVAITTSDRAIVHGIRGEPQHQQHQQPQQLASPPSITGTSTASTAGTGVLPNMSNTQPQPQPPPQPQPRPPVAYASPAPYPPTAIPPVSHYTYPPQPLSAVADPYRPPAPTTLPSMRTLENHGQPQPPSHHGIPLTAHMAPPMPPTPTPGPMPPYYGIPPHPAPPYYSIPDPNSMRFFGPGLAHDPRFIGQPRHKKEIKRRTKTGCLTCRKRRIKCDEAHPTCNNCKKSKRECLGYDPIFRQQGQAAIQPAPSNNNNSQSSSSASSSAAPAPAPASAPPSASTPGAAPVPSSAPAPASASGPTPAPAPPCPPLVSSSSAATPTAVTTSAPPPQPANGDSSYAYSAAIDPALHAVDSTSAASSQVSQVSRYPQPNAGANADASAGPSPGSGTEQGATGVPSNLRGGIPNPPSSLSALPQPQPQPQSRESISAHTSSPAKIKMNIHDLISLAGPLPQPSSAPPSTETMAEIKRLYYEVYVPGLSRFFETQWYDFVSNRATASNPDAILHGNQHLLSLFALFVSSISKIKSTDPMDMAHSAHLETHLIWSLACLPLLTPPPVQQRPHLAPAPDDPWEARGRLQVFEALVSGETLTMNPLTPPNPNDADIRRRNELEFWYNLAKYLLREHSSPSPADVSVRECCLQSMRALLGGLENRDVLYSIAVLREYTRHWDACWNEQTVPSHLDESDARSKLAVATRFIRDESLSTRGTTNVVRRFTDLAYRAFVRPGVNVIKS